MGLKYCRWCGFDVVDFGGVLCCDGGDYSVVVYVKGIGCMLIGC